MRIQNLPLLGIETLESTEIVPTELGVVDSIGFTLAFRLVLDVRRCRLVLGFQLDARHGGGMDLGV